MQILHCDLIVSDRLYGTENAFLKIDNFTERRQKNAAICRHGVKLKPSRVFKIFMGLQLYLKKYNWSMSFIGYFISFLTRFLGVLFLFWPHCISVAFTLHSLNITSPLPKLTCVLRFIIFGNAHF